MKLEKSEVKRILFITLSNIGDCVLTLPVLDILKDGFAQATFTVMVSQKARELFVDDPRVERIIIFDKKAHFKEQAKLFFELRQEQFDCLVDLRNTAFPLFLKSRVKTMPFLRIPATIEHMKHRHIYRVKSLFDAFAAPEPHRHLWRGKEAPLSINLESFGLPQDTSKDAERAEAQTSDFISKFVEWVDFYKASRPLSIFTSQLGRDYIKELLNKDGVKEGDKLICVSPGAANHIKQWTAEGFAKICDKLIDELKAKIVFVGDKKDEEIVSQIVSLMKNKASSFAGKTTLRELAFLLSRAKLLISCDSAVMHMGSYLNIPVFAIFGPTDADKYGPWSDKSFVYKADLSCSPCEKSGCSSNLECMRQINPDEVYKGIKEFLGPKKPEPEKTEIKLLEQTKKILIIRTDRIGDVILTTPVIKALRQAYPRSFISIMVSPIARDIVEGNPYLDEVIVYDRKGKDKGIFGFLRFVSNLKKRNFDLALNFHTKKRTNLIIYLAGIKERIGYDNKKFSFLLTKRLKDSRIEGKKHEAEYCLDVLKEIGINTDDKQLFMPLKETSEKWSEVILKENNIKPTDTLVVVHPSASCPSRRWPIERFAQLCNKLIEAKGFKIAIISGQKDSYIVKMVKRYLRHSVVDLSGKTSVSQLASFLKRARLLISNDSGPVHIAAAVGTPVIAIFGRKQAGLSPVRWRPLGEKNIILHKDAGCKVCLAHNCKIGFACLGAIYVKEVLEAVDAILKERNV